MKRFLQENWIWIVIPIVLMTVGLVTLMILAGGTEGENGFTYSLF